MKRERDHRLWERQVEVVEDTIQHERNLAQKRGGHWVKVMRVTAIFEPVVSRITSADRELPR